MNNTTADTNPIATILSAGMMLAWLGSDESSFGGRLIFDAVKRICSNPQNATPDLGGTVTTSGMGALVEQAILRSV